MNAPDKIYIEQKAVMYDMVNTEPCKPDDYEYIRKDALLEYANNGIKRVKEDSSLNSIIAQSAIAAFEELIEKLNSM